MELVLEDIQFSYDKGLPTEKVVLDSLSLRVKEGEFLSIIGRTGSGKTTLGLIMAGLLNPTGGRVVALEEGVNIGMVFQFPESQFFEENVFREIAFGPSRLGLGRDEIKRRVAAAMTKMKLDSHALSDRSTLSLSQGEKRKVAIASVLSCSPRFLVLDEPTVSLDWEASAHIFEILNELKQSGVSVIVMTHEVDYGSLYCDRTIVLTGGKLVRSAGTRKGGPGSGNFSTGEVYRILSQEEPPLS